MLKRKQKGARRLLLKLLAVGALASLLLASVVLVSAVSGGSQGPIRQPIQFNHLVHTQEWELDCDVCHQHVRQEEYAGRPPLEVCAACHEDPLTESAEEAILVESIKAGQEIPWRRLYNVPSHVYYSHRRHVTVAGIDCVQCHGDIGISTVPPEAPLKALTMKFCVECHEASGATTDCNACHR